MPSLRSSRRTGTRDCSTTRMMSTFSEARDLMPRRPPPRSCFFEQAVLQDEIGHDLLQRARLAAQVSHLVRSRRAGRVAGQSLLAGLQELLGPAVVHRAGDTLAPTQLGDTVLTAQAFQHDADLLLGRNCRRVARRMSLITASVPARMSASSSCLTATMNPPSS